MLPARCGNRKRNWRGRLWCLHSTVAGRIGFVSDESAAIRSAVHWVYPEVAWQHGIFHRLAQLRRDIGATDYRNRMAAEAACVFRCPSLAAQQDKVLPPGGTGPVFWPDGPTK